MKKAIFAFILLLMLLGPMFWGIRQLRKLPRPSQDAQDDAD